MKSYLKILTNIILSSIGLSVILGSFLRIIGPINQSNKVNRKINTVFEKLSKNIKNPKTELNYKNHYTFLISVVLSAQTTDKAVNESTINLFKIVKKPEEMIKLGERKLKSYIRSIGLYNSKAKNIINLSK